MTNSSAGVSPVFSYQYDAENRLVKALSNGVAVLECWYDGAGHRIAKREVIGTQTNTWQYIWDGWNLVAVLGVDGKLKEFYTRGVGIAGDIGTLVAVRHWTNVISGPLYYLHNNHRGDVILARQGSATVAALDYAPYGESRSQTGSYTPRFRFSSKEYDASTGFYHFPYRYYAPQWARWLSRDPLGEGASLNLFVYGKNAPVVAVDPDGRIPWVPVCCIACAGFAIWDLYDAVTDTCVGLSGSDLAGCLLEKVLGLAGLGDLTSCLAAAITTGGKDGSTADKIADCFKCYGLGALKDVGKAISCGCCFVGLLPSPVPAPPPLPA
jgi:RHS repeat-associated protein